MPDVAVVIPTHNRADLLPRALASVCAQTFSNLECIVVDDGSTDDTENAVASMGDKRIVYVRRNGRGHASAARNTGIACSTAPLIAFLDDDDEWLPTKLQKQIALLSKLPETVGMVYCWMDYFDHEGRLVKSHRPALKGSVFPFVLDAQRLGGCPTLLVRKSVVEAVGGFDESILRGNDGDFIRRVCHDYHVDYVPEVLVKVHIGHPWRRISSNDEKGIKSAICGHLVKVIKFANEATAYPEQFANIYSTIGYLFVCIGRPSKGARFFLKALRVRPGSQRVHKEIKKSLRCLIEVRRK